MMPARALMFQGTGSDVGKSLIVAGLARAFTQARPDGAAVQAAEHVEQCRGDGRRRRDRPRPGAAGARRARAAERAHESGAAEAAERDRRADRGAGPRLRHAPRRADYQAHEAASCCRTCSTASRGCSARPISCWSKAPAAPSEVNLRANDIANMGFARAADVPVVLIGDIDRGGVIASLVGTKAVIDRRRRGADRAASSSTSSAAIRRCSPTAWRTIAQRDRLAGARPRAAFSPTRGGCRPRMRWRSTQRGRRKPDARVRIAVPILPHIANFDDLDPLEAEPGGRAGPRAAGRGAAGRCRSRHPAGLEGDHRRSRGVARRRLRHRHRRASCAAAAWCSACAAAIRCSGARIADPDGIEGPPATVEGLGLLDVETVLSDEKRLEPVARHDQRRRRRSPATRCIWA